MRFFPALVLLALYAAACVRSGFWEPGATVGAAADGASSDAVLLVDAASPDTTPVDAASPDTAPVDAALPDTAPVDAAVADALAPDSAAPDTSLPDVPVLDGITALLDVDPGDSVAEDAGDPTMPRWAAIPTVDYQMGCVPQDATCLAGESPRHPVTVSSFELTATEVTQEQYEAAMGNHANAHAACPTCPVDSVTWAQCQTYCQTIGGRLPSEAEWECAARGGTGTTYPCGDSSACVDDVAWHRGNSNTGGGRETQPVGQKSANGFGLHDMPGNVWEWTADCWHSDYTGAPSTAVVWVGGANEDCSVNSARGGSFFTTESFLRSSSRYSEDPTVVSGHFGCRCARD